MNDPFHNLLSKQSKEFDKSFRTAKILFAVWSVFCLALLVVVIFVIAHFVGKYW